MITKAKYVLRVLVGVVFLFSAISKFLSIDDFELYFFSLEIFSLGTSLVLTRVLIAAEAVLGLWMILNINHKLTNSLIYVVLGLFSGFLFGDMLSGNVDNCHCFGEFISLNPMQSLIKNAVLVILTFVSTGGRMFDLKHSKLISVVAALIVSATVFIVSPPDNFRYDSYKSSDMVNLDALNQAITGGDVSTEILKGEKVVCFFSVKCEFCEMSAQKLGVLRRLGEISRGEVYAYFGKGETTTIEQATDFISNARLDCNNVHFISPSEFLKITNGSFPLILVLNDGVVVGKYSYRDLH